MSDADTDEGGDAERQELLASARDLAAAGLVGEAVDSFRRAGEPGLAASLLASEGRLWDAAHLLLEVAGEAPEEVLPGGARREQALRAAAYFRRCDDRRGERRVFELMRGLVEDERIAYEHLVSALEKIDPRARRRARSERPTPPMRTSRPPARRERTTTRRSVRPVDGLRKPSAPDLKIETISTPPESRSQPPGRPSGVLRKPSRPPRSRPTDESIDRSIEQLILADRRDAAAKIALLAGRYEQALPLFLEIKDFVSAGTCLRSLRRPEEAIVELRRTPPGGPGYREACREIAKAAAQLGYLAEGARIYCGPFIDSGPRSDQEIPAFLDFAELLWANREESAAERALQGVLRLDPESAPASLMQLAWTAQRMREGSNA